MRRTQPRREASSQPLTHEERVELIRTPITFCEYGCSLPTAGNRCYVNLERSWLRDDEAPPEGADVMEQAS